MQNCGMNLQQSKLIQRMGGSGVEDYNMQKLVSYYRGAINSAQNPEEARAFAQSLEGVLSNVGKGLNDISGLNTAKLTQPGGNKLMANGLKAGGGCNPCHGCGKCSKKAHQGKALDLKG
jgi:hypothetical protein